MDASAEIDSVAELDGGSSDIGRCESEVAGCVDASAWAKEISEIDRFCFNEALDGDRTKVTLKAEDSAKLGVLEVDQISSGDNSAPAGAISATLTPPDGEPLTMTTKGMAREHGYRVDMTLENSQMSLDIRALFTTNECYERRKPARNAGPPCTWPLAIGDRPVSLPTCGAIVSRLEESGLPPNLHMVQYRKNGKIPQDVGGVAQTETGKVSTMTAYLGGTGVKNRVIRDWLQQTGADAIVGTKAEKLLSVAYLEQAWRNEVSNLQHQCETESGADANQSRDQGLSCRQFNLADDEMSTRRQATGCGDNWLGGGDGGGGAWGGGDPHFMSYDGTGFNFQGAGEYILAESSSGTTFEIQARMEPLKAPTEFPACDDVSYFTAAAFQIGEHEIGVYPKRDKSYWLNGSPVNSARALVNKDLSGLNVSVTTGNRLILEAKNGARATVEIQSDILDIESQLPDSMLGQVSGLFGYFNGSEADDFRTRSGKIVEQPLTLEQMYRQFGDAWRVKPKESLFNYKEGKTTFSYRNQSFPKSAASLQDLPKQARQDAQEECRSIEQRPAKKWCILDTVCTGDGAIGRQNAKADNIDSTQNIREGVSFKLIDDFCQERPATLDHRPVDETVPKCSRQQRQACARVYRESSAKKLPSKLEVDIRGPGRYESASELDGGTISSGTRVSSFVVHLQELYDTSETVEGHIVTSQKILGVVVNPSSFDRTTQIFGEDGITYPTDVKDRGIDWAEDNIELDQNRKRLSVLLEETDDIDLIRFFVKAPND